ncbi:MAG: hypothetical protein V4719_17215 [Planctomycetota bacterium]
MTSDDASPVATPSGASTEEVNVDRELPSSSQPAGAKSASSWSRLARRISSRTTDLLAIGIVVVVSLTMGRQILEWWRADAPAVLDLGPLDNASAEWGAGSRPVALEFGNSPLSMTRQMVSTGGVEAALSSVRERCQQALVSIGEPDGPPDMSEVEQLEALALLSPDVQQPGWQLFSLDGGMAAVVGVKTFGGKPGNLDPASPSGRRRVVCWGLVFPGLSQGVWTAYTFVRRPKDVSQPSALSPVDFDLSRMELPPECQRTVLMQEAGQAGLLGFRGRLDPAVWQRHFESWLQVRGWKLAEPWTHPATGWSGRFVSSKSDSANESTIQIHFYQHNAQQGVGLIHWLPSGVSPPVAPLN